MILGDEAFDAVASEYVTRSPPSSPVLAGYGEGFADFLAKHPLAGELSYLTAVAQIDRLRVECHLAADAPAFDLEDLVRLSTEEWSRCRVTLHPATRMAWFKLPAPSIWVAHLDPERVEIAPEWQAEGILVARCDGAVGGHVIGPCEHRILHGLRLGETVGHAALAASRLYASANISRAFRTIVASGALTSVQTRR